MTTEGLAQLCRVLADLWPSWKASPGMIALWHQLLSDLEDRHVQTAALLHAATSNFPPTVAELRSRAIRERSGKAAAEALSAPEEVSSARKLLGLHVGVAEKASGNALAERAGEAPQRAAESRPASDAQRQEHLASIFKKLKIAREKGDGAVAIGEQGEGA